MTRQSSIKPEQKHLRPHELIINTDSRTLSRISKQTRCRDHSGHEHPQDPTRSSDNWRILSDLESFGKGSASRQRQRVQADQEHRQQQVQALGVHVLLSPLPAQFAHVYSYHATGGFVTSRIFLVDQLGSCSAPIFPSSYPSHINYCLCVGIPINAN
ncbi:hypothetical protein GOP47_0001431 [Adiantum capillus-veneris]|uniref:Uncharacterized protein n=1 Tax=Adiantum capillus-veneris TaxID=13818 RepID=A0A9D4V8P2_ADICA|nr:hypothetical protein GOP47_0001431 [Adiantum capillus-veneris]